LIQIKFTRAQAKLMQAKILQALGYAAAVGPVAGSNHLRTIRKFVAIWGPSIEAGQKIAKRDISGYRGLYCAFDMAGILLPKYTRWAAVRGAIGEFPFFLQ
jgi:hypothetical protein